MHIGGDAALLFSEAVGFFDLDGCTRGPDTNRFLQNREKDGRLEQTSAEHLPRSFIVKTDDTVYLSPITTATLTKRLSETENREWIR